MKKYKHTKLGITAEWSIKHEMYETWIDSGTIQYLSKELVQNSNDWEEVKEEPFIQQYGRVDRVKDPIETIISDKYPIKNMIKAKTYETLAQKLFTSSIIYTATDGISIREGSKTTLYLLNKDDLSIVKPFYKVDIFNFSKQDKEVADRYLTFTSEENRDKYIKENTKKPVFVSEDGVELFEEPEYVYSVLTKGLWPMERNYFYNHKYKSPEWKHFVTKEARQEYIDNNKPKYSLADIKKAYEEAFDETFTEIEIELKKLGK